MGNAEYMGLRRPLRGVRGEVRHGYADQRPVQRRGLVKRPEIFGASATDSLLCFIIVPSNILSLSASATFCSRKSCVGDSSRSQEFAWKDLKVILQVSVSSPLRPVSNEA